MTYRRAFLEVMGPGASDLVKIAGTRLVGAKLVDNFLGKESDEAIFTLTDEPPFFPIPGIGTPYVVRLGWSETNAAITGVYTFQRVHFQGDPKQGRRLQLICRSGDLSKDLKQMGSEHFDKETGHTTYGDVFRSLFKGMDVVISPTIASKQLPGASDTDGGYLLRWKQSAIDFATELAENNGAIVAPKGGKMVVMDLASGTSASGKDLPALTILYDPNYEYDVELEPRFPFEKFSGFHFDTGKGSEQSEEESFGSGGQGQGTLPHPSSYKDSAEAQAKAVAQEGAQFKGNGLFVMAGEPKAVSNAPAKCVGFRPEIDAVDWLIERVTHDVDPVRGGWITTVETLERGL